jgi:hypothetical protein
MNQLLQLVPLTSARKNRLEKRTFQNLSVVANDLSDIFDISIFDGISTEDVSFAKLMFHRRHVYEHAGGEADEKYLADSGDKSIRLKELLRETQESAHKILGIVMRLAKNLHDGFHQIIPPDRVPIERYEKWKPKRK